MTNNDTKYPYTRAELEALHQRIITASEGSYEIEWMMYEAFTGNCAHKRTEDFRVLAVDNITMVDSGFRCVKCKKELWSERGGNSQRPDTWKSYTRSVDAALEYMKEQFPEWEAKLITRSKDQRPCVLFAPDAIWHASVLGEGSTLALAACAALLSAHIKRIDNMTLHPDTEKLVDDFAIALKAKLLSAQVKRGVTNEWLTDEWEEECRRQLQIHVDKGDPLDVAAYAAFCWSRGWKTSTVNKV